MTQSAGWGDGPGWNISPQRRHGARRAVLTPEMGILEGTYIRTLGSLRQPGAEMWWNGKRD